MLRKLVPFSGQSFLVPELDYWKAVLKSVGAPKVEVLPYAPKRRERPSRVLPVDTAWKGIESILGDLIQRFEIPTRRCLEFGVEYGYSTAALSSFFDSVVGVDIFIGDKHTDNKADIFSETAHRLSSFKNIKLERSDYQDWIAADNTMYDLIHVDIVHTYIDTYTCGLWSAHHAKCVLFHDTESFPAVKRAVLDVSRNSGKKFYNFKESNGLGIVT